MAEHNAPFAHIAYQHADGTTGVLDNHDAEAIHDGAETVKTENLEDASVTNGKIAPDAVTGVELAAESVSKEHLSPEMQASWDSLSQVNAGSWALINSGGNYERHFISRGKEYMLVVDVEYGALEVYNVTDNKRLMRLP